VIVRVTKPEAFLLPPVRRLFQAALIRGAKNAERSINKLAALAGRPDVGIFIGLERGEPQCGLSIMLPPDPETDRPLLDIGANLGGSPALKRELLGVALAFMREAGYNQAWFFNFSGHSDKAYLRAARAAGMAARVRTSMLEVDF
jgi:hypothetical protein